MFRIGGSAGTGITSGKLDQPQKMANGGRTGYYQGSMPFSINRFTRFFNCISLNLLATPPQGNIFQTIALAAQDPFRRLQADQASAMKTASD